MNDHWQRPQITAETPGVTRGRLARHYLNNVQLRGLNARLFGLVKRLADPATADGIPEEINALLVLGHTIEHESRGENMQQDLAAVFDLLAKEDVAALRAWLVKTYCPHGALRTCPDCISPGDGFQNTTHTSTGR